MRQLATGGSKRSTRTAPAITPIGWLKRRGLRSSHNTAMRPFGLLCRSIKGKKMRCVCQRMADSSNLGAYQRRPRKLRPSVETPTKRLSSKTRGSSRSANSTIRLRACARLSNTHTHRLTRTSSSDATLLLCATVRRSCSSIRAPTLAVSCNMRQRGCTIPGRHWLRSKGRQPLLDAAWRADVRAPDVCNTLVAVVTTSGAGNPARRNATRSASVQDSATSPGRRICACTPCGGV